MVDIASWLVNKLGVPNQQPIKFNVEYIIKGGKYIGTSMTASTLSEIIEKVFIDSKKEDVGRMVIKPVVLNEVCKFQLLGSDRI